jgi:Uma2 family endonuclease
MTAMGVPIQKPRYSIQEYYRIETDATEKHEFRGGEILAMSGGAPEHATIALNFAAELRASLKSRPCQPYNSDLRIRITGQDRTAYPDVSIICGPIEYDPDDKARHTVLNPRVIVEVLSPSTEAYDRGDKFAAYREIPSLEEYVLVSQNEPRVETYLRQKDGTWSFAPFAGLQAVAKLRSIHIEVPLAEIYANIDFVPPSAPPASLAEQ